MCIEVTMARQIQAHHQTDCDVPIIVVFKPL